ncbi:MAG: ABC transporter permease [Gammaproteobacteria bacterium]
MLAIAGKEVRQLRRDRLSFGMIIGIPLLQIVLFGYAIDLDVRHLEAAVADLSGTQAARNLVAAAEATQVVDVRRRVGSAQALETLLDRGEIAVGIYIPPDFERRLQDEQRPAAQLLVDGSDPVIEGIARGLLEVPGRTRIYAGEKPSPVFEVRTFYNPERRSAVQIVPALIGVILNLTMVLFTAIAIVRERERGNLELLITTPIATPELMIAKIAPYVLIGLVQVTIILAAGVWLFDVPIRGSLLDLYLAALAFIAATLSLGLLISTLAQTQFQAMQLTVFTFLPSILLSGFMFPFDGMPRAAQWVAEIMPLTHFVRLVRGILLRGADLAELMTPIYALAAFFAVTVTLAILRFHKRLD